MFYSWTWCCRFYRRPSPETEVNWQEITRACARCTLKLGFRLATCTWLFCWTVVKKTQPGGHREVKSARAEVTPRGLTHRRKLERLVLQGWRVGWGCWRGGEVVDGWLTGANYRQVEGVPEGLQLATVTACFTVARREDTSVSSKEIVTVWEHRCTCRSGRSQQIIHVYWNVPAIHKYTLYQLLKTINFLHTSFLYLQMA